MKATDKEGLVILMADGNLEDHRTVQQAARECHINHVFTSVYNGAQLLDYLFRKGAYRSSQEELPDLLILDIVLDRVTGFEVLELIKDDRELRRIPVYVLTRNKKEEHEVKARQLGVCDFIEKPVSIEEWREIIQRICSSSLRKPRTV